MRNRKQAAVPPTKPTVKIVPPMAAALMEHVAALQGMGIVLQPAILLEADVQAGRLVQLFPHHALATRPMNTSTCPTATARPSCAALWTLWSSGSSSANRGNLACF